MDVRNLATTNNRHPDLDPKRSMRVVAIESRFERTQTGTSASAHDMQRPLIGGMQCAPLLVDCAATAGAAPALDAERSSPAKANASAGVALPSSESNTVTTGSDGRMTMPTASNKKEVGAQAEGSMGARTSHMLPLRLANGARVQEGRLEVEFNGSWGSVCSKGWGWTAAHVACLALGFGGVDSVSATAAFGRSSGIIWMSHVDCRGTEWSLDRCRFYGLGQSTIPPGCTHELDVGLICSKLRMPVPQYTPVPEHLPLESARHSTKVPSSVGHGTSGVTPGTSFPHSDALPGSAAQPQAGPHHGGTPSDVDLSIALDQLERVIIDLEQRRPIIDDADVARMTRLRLRLRRLAGKPSTDEQGYGLCEINSPGASDGGKLPPTDQKVRSDAAEAAIPEALAARLAPEMLDELRKMPRIAKSLEEGRREFEEQRRQEAFDPVANDPVEQQLQQRRDQYVPEVNRPPLIEPKPHERLRKPPIQNLANRRPPSWKDAHEARVAYTKEQIRLGLAPEGIERTLGPGPWDHDPAFWSTPQAHDRHVVLDHEMDEDIVFDGY